MARKPVQAAAARRRAASAWHRDQEIDMVADVQAVLPGWLVIWSMWRREFTAFCCFAEKAIIVDDRIVERLVARAREKELAHAYDRAMR